MIDSNLDMENLIKEKFLFSKEKIQGFFDTNPVQQSLRDQVEELHMEIGNLNEQMRANQDRLGELDKNSTGDQHNAQAKLEKALADIRERDIII